MAILYDDGTVISSNIPTFQKQDLSIRNDLKDFGIYKAAIMEILYTDSIKNSNKKDVEYTIRLLHGSKSGLEFTNVRALNLGGFVNFSEEILEFRKTKISGSEEGKGASPDNFDNNFVMIAFFEGDKKPVILGGWPHPRRIFKGSQKSEGKRIVKEYNGLRYNINKDGELILTYYGGERNSETLETINKTTAPLQLKIDKTGSFYIIDKEVQQIKIDRVNKITSITQYENTLSDENIENQYNEGYLVDISSNNKINEIKLDKTNKKISLNQYDGANKKIGFELDNTNKKISLELIDESMKFEIDQSNKKITISDNTTSITLYKTSDKITIYADNIELGDASLEYIVKSKKLTDWITNTLKVWADTHIHGSAVGPTTVPTVPLTQATESEIASLKHKVE